LAHFLALALSDRGIIKPGYPRRQRVNLRTVGAAFPAAPEAMETAIDDVNAEGRILTISRTLWTGNPLLDWSVPIYFDA
jgi:hypothetical protein